ncbi:MAG: AraC family transcriptional regulator [Bacteroidales bacterium]|nr:AraC family transcriptional regulator [Bacteroidales bacterium]
MNGIKSEYRKRINKAFDYIENNISKQISIEELADVANFSKYHFHRIFASYTGEPPAQFINRLRLEKAAMMLVMNKNDNISDIAEKTGFTDLSIFSRNFKNYFGISAGEYRKSKNSNISQMLSKNRQIEDTAQMYFCQSTNTLKWRTNMELNKSVEVKELPKMNLAYIRHIGPYMGNEKLFEGLWNRLFAWAGPRGLIGGPGFKSLIIYHDDPNLCDHDKLRTSVCITVPENTPVDGEVGTMKLEGGKYVVARFEVGPEDFGTAWEWLYGKWFPQSGYQPDEKPCFEMYPEEPKDGKFIVDICVGVKAL